MSGSLIGSHACVRALQIAGESSDNIAAVETKLFSAVGNFFLIVLAKPCSFSLCVYLCVCVFV
eukprot:COSAG05_NODE_284_length_12237_cov_15.252266_3_plen_63_part_00